MDNVELLVKVLLIAGALNWGLVAAFDFDLVTFLTSFIPDNKENFLNSDRLVKLIVGGAGLAAIAYMY
jgi:uncharacterized membrane protein YuzA (DUF378 family)